MRPDLRGQSLQKPMKDGVVLFHAIQDVSG